jgi:hypothetical protein
MSYMLLIVEPPDQRSTRSTEDGHAVYQRMLDYAQSLESRGVLLGVNSLKREAVRLHKPAGKPSVMDGPFTEAREFIGGYFLLDCQTPEQARAYAEQCPAAEWATIEIREVGPCYD